MRLISLSIIVLAGCIAMGLSLSARDPQYEGTIILHNTGLGLLAIGIVLFVIELVRSYIRGGESQG